MVVSGGEVCIVKPRVGTQLARELGTGGKDVARVCASMHRDASARDAVARVARRLTAVHALDRWLLLAVGGVGAAATRLP